MVKKTIKLSRYSTEGLIENEYEPGGNVLKNKLGIRKVKEMGKVEGEVFLKTQRHFYNLFSEDPPPRITEDLIKELHHITLFQPDSFDKKGITGIDRRDSFYHICWFYQVSGKINISWLEF